MTVYVLDTGIRETHEDFDGGRARRDPMDFVDDGWNVRKFKRTVANLIVGHIWLGLLPSR